jgi:hypothetical protein
MIVCAALHISAETFIADKRKALDLRSNSAAGKAQGSLELVHNCTDQESSFCKDGGTREVTGIAVWEIAGMLLIFGSVFGLAIVVAARMGRRWRPDVAHLGWMSGQWLAEYKGSRPNVG